MCARNCDQKRRIKQHYERRWRYWKDFIDEVFRPQKDWTVREKLYLAHAEVKGYSLLLLGSEEVFKSSAYLNSLEQGERRKIYYNVVFNIKTYANLIKTLYLSKTTSTYRCNSFAAQKRQATNTATSKWWGNVLQRLIDQRPLQT